MRGGESERSSDLADNLYLGDRDACDEDLRLLTPSPMGEPGAGSSDHRLDSDSALGGADCGPDHDERWQTRDRSSICGALGGSDRSLLQTELLDRHGHRRSDGVALLQPDLEENLLQAIGETFTFSHFPDTEQHSWHEACTIE